MLFKSAKRKQTEPAKLVSAKDAYESTKTPQIMKAVENINEARQRGTTMTYICDRDKPCDELLNMLTSAGYDVHIHMFEHGPLPEFFTQAIWNSDVSGKVTFEDAMTKKAFPGFLNNQNDIYNTLP